MDILVDNAAVSPVGPTERTSEADFDAAYAVNVKVPFFPVPELAPAMVQIGKGSIVDIVSQVARFGLAQTALYGSSNTRTPTPSSSRPCAWIYRTLSFLKHPRRVRQQHHYSRGNARRGDRGNARIREL